MILGNDQEQGTSAGTDALVKTNMTNLQDNITGHWHSTCQNWNCTNKAYAKYAGMIECKKHYERTLISDYGSLKKAKKYISKGVNKND